MIITQLQPLPDRKIAFKRSEYTKIPTVAGCYVLSTFQNDILYIGQSLDLNRRFQEHLDYPEKTRPTDEGAAFWFHFLEYEAKRVGVLENTWLHTFEMTEGRLPTLNKVRSPG